jgi:hypothetical protein
LSILTRRAVYHRDVEPLFRTATIPASDTAGYEDALHDIHVGKLDLLIVTGAIPARTCASVVEKLEDRSAKYRWTPQEHPDIRKKQFLLIGEPLSPYVGHPDGPELAHYYAEGAYVRAKCRELFGPEVDFERSIESCFARLGGGRKIVLPEGILPGTHYTPATLRALPPECEIPVHVGNYFITTPATRHLATLVDLDDQLSYFVPLHTPEAGGELVVYRFEWGMEPPEMTREARANWDDQPERWPCMSFAPSVGDLLLFNGGRFYHRVSRVKGNRARWTIGGFVSFSPDGSSVLYWS